MRLRQYAIANDDCYHLPLLFLLYMIVFLQFPTFINAAPPPIEYQIEYRDCNFSDDTLTIGPLDSKLVISSLLVDNNEVPFKYKLISSSPAFYYEISIKGLSTNDNLTIHILIQETDNPISISSNNIPIATANPVKLESSKVNNHETTDISDSHFISNK